MKPMECIRVFSSSWTYSWNVLWTSPPDEVVFVSFAVAEETDRLRIQAFASWKMEGLELQKIQVEKLHNWTQILQVLLVCNPPTLKACWIASSTETGACSRYCDHSTCMNHGHSTCMYYDHGTRIICHGAHVQRNWERRVQGAKLPGKAWGDWGAPAPPLLCVPTRNISIIIKIVEHFRIKFWCFRWTLGQSTVV